MTLPLFRLPSGSRSTRTTAGAHTNSGWSMAVRSAIEALAGTGRPFQANDVRTQFGLSEPANHHQWGAAFAAARRDGVIERIAGVPSTRRSVASSLTSLWVGTPAWRTSSEALGTAA